MRQAIVIQNPNWEPFTKASDAFKALSLKAGESVILVVRGRSKEKRNGGIGPSRVVKSKPDSPEALAADLRKQGAKPDEIKKAVKSFKPLAKAAAMIAFMMFALTASAQQDILPKLPLTYVAGLSTNTSAGSGFVGWNIDQVAVFQLTITGTNAGAAGPITVSADTSDNGTDWLATQYNFVSGSAGNGTATAITRATNTIGAKYIRFARVVNTNAATGGVTITRFTVSIKDY